MFYIIPKSRREWVITLLRPFWLYLAVAFPVYHILYNTLGLLLMSFVAGAMSGLCILSCLVLLVSSLILFVMGTAHDKVLFRCALVNIPFVALGAVLSLYFPIFLK